MTQIQTDKSHILKQGVGQGVELSTSTNWRSIYIATVLSFIGSVQFSLYFSALWPYIQILDHGTSENFFGLTVACYSIGQIISSPLFGLWSNKSKSIRHPLCMGLLLMLFGNVIYILMEIFPFHKRYVLLIARFVIGLGSGNVTLLRLYASTASTATDRTKAISYITAGQAIGMVIGPVGQFLFVPLEYPGFRLLNVLSFNLYTAPAWLACLMNLTGLVMLFCLFKEVYAGIKEQTNDADDCSLTISEVSEKPSYDRLAAFICYMTRFTDMFTRTCFEVLAGPLAMMFFALDESHSVTIISISQSFVGGLTLGVYVLFIFFRLDRFIQLRNGCIVALIGMLSFYILTYSYPFLPSHVPITSLINTTDDAVGCNDLRFEWCQNLTAFNLYYFYGAYAIIIGLAFPLLTITMNSLFSKILGPIRQGKQQGILQASSALARMIGPLTTSALYSGFGPRPVWLLQMLVILLTLGAWITAYKRMIPMIVDKDSKNNKVHPV